jgi:hypothetical protein
MKQAGERTKALLSNATIVSELGLANPPGKKEETDKKIVEWCGSLKEANFSA